MPRLARLLDRLSLSVSFLGFLCAMLAAPPMLAAPQALAQDSPDERTLEAEADPAPAQLDPSQHERPAEPEPSSGNAALGRQLTAPGITEPGPSLPLTGAPDAEPIPSFLALWGSGWAGTAIGLAIGPLVGLIVGGVLVGTNTPPWASDPFGLFAMFGIGIGSSMLAGSILGAGINIWRAGDESHGGGAGWAALLGALLGPALAGVLGALVGWAVHPENGPLIGMGIGLGGAALVLPQLTATLGYEISRSF